MEVPRRTEAVGSTGLSPEPWERVVTISGLIAGLLALPLPPIASGPEIASTLAVSAVITLAGLRWGVALLVVTEALLVATFWPYVMTGDGDTTLRIIGAASCLATLPGLYSIGRAAPHLLELFGFDHSPNAARAARRLLAAGALVLVALPLF